MSERCERCGALLALVGFVHRCVPRDATLTLADGTKLKGKLTIEPKCLMAPPTKSEPKNTAHPDKPVKTKNPAKPKPKKGKKK